MPKARRTEHCWPVAHTVDDLIPLIPDPASYEAGSSLFIERIMLPDVHLQFVKAIADRFCPDNGWQTVYIVANKYRVAEVEDGAGRADVIYSEHNKKKIHQLLHEVSEEGLKPFVVTEGNVVIMTKHTMKLPLPVKAASNINCDHCNAELPLMWHKHNKYHFSKCYQCNYIARASINIQIKGVLRARNASPKSLEYWKKEESKKAYQLKESGYTHERIGKLIGRSKFAVTQHFRSGGYEGMMQRQKQRQYLNQFDDI